HHGGPAQGRGALPRAVRRAARREDAARPGDAPRQAGRLTQVGGPPPPGAAPESAPPGAFGQGAALAVRKRPRRRTASARRNRTSSTEIVAMKSAATPTRTSDASGWALASQSAAGTAASPSKDSAMLEKGSGEVLTA